MATNILKHGVCTPISIQRFFLVLLCTRNTLVAGGSLRSVEEPGMEKPELDTCHSETTSVCGVAKPYKRPQSPIKDTWFLPNLAPATSQTHSVSAPCLPCLNHPHSAAFPWRDHTLTRCSTVSAFHKRLAGLGEPSAVSLGRVGRKGLLWGQLPTEGVLALKRLCWRQRQLWRCLVKAIAIHAGG